MSKTLTHGDEGCAPETPSAAHASLYFQLAVLAALFVAIDLAVPLGVAGGIPYLALVLLTLRTAERRPTWIAAAAGVVLVVVGWTASPPGGLPWVVAANRLMAIGAIGVTALLCDRSKASQALLATRRLELRRQLEATAQAEARFRLAFEASPNAMLMSSDDGAIVLANAMAEQLFGYGRGDLVGLSVDALVPEHFRGAHPAHRRAFLQSPSTRAMGAGRDLFAIRRDGTELPVEVGLNPLQTDEGNFVLSAIVDISARRRSARELARYTEELRRSNEELDAFARGASHDLKAPLRAIQHLAQWIAEDASDRLPPASSEHLATLQQRARRMEKLLDDLLEYSRAGRLEASVEQLDMRALIGDVAELLSPPPSFRVAVASTLPTLRAARAPLEQVFRNLIDNAIKHHDRDAGRIEVSAEDRGSYMRFCVEDDGPGIPEASTSAPSACSRRCGRGTRSRAAAWAWR